MLHSVLFTYTHLSEYKNRHPCVVDHRGHALHFAGEDKHALAGTAPKKPARPKARRAPTSESSSEDDEPAIAHAAAQKSGKTKKRRPPPTQPFDSEESSEGEVPTLPARKVIPGPSSPSGRIRKRARLGPSSQCSVSPTQPVVDRPVKSLPVRSVAETSKDTHNAHGRKRKHSMSAAVQVDEVWPQGDFAREESIAPGPFAQQDRGVTLMFPPPFPPAPFSIQPTYAAHPPFTGPAYQPPFYPPTYAQQGWPPSNPTNTHQQWPASHGYTQEEMDAFLAMRRGFGNGGTY